MPFSRKLHQQQNQFIATNYETSLEPATRNINTIWKQILFDSSIEKEKFNVA